MGSRRISETHDEWLARERDVARRRYHALSPEQRRDLIKRRAARLAERYRTDPVFREREKQRTHDRYHRLTQEQRRNWSTPTPKSRHRKMVTSRLRRQNFTPEQREVVRQQDELRYRRRLANPAARKWTDWYQSNKERRALWRARWYDQQFAKGIEDHDMREAILTWRRLKRVLTERFFLERELPDTPSLSISLPDGGGYRDERDE